MYELPQEIPDVALLLELEPEELGAKLLALMRKRLLDPSNSNRGQFIFSNLDNELWQNSHNPNQPQYPRNKQEEVSLAFSEAWAWLEAQGLLVPASGSSGQTGWRVMSRRAKKMESSADFVSFQVGRLLPKDMLNPRISDTVWSAFMRGEFDVAAFQAMKSVEVAVRAAAQLGNDLIGVPLMRAAFSVDNGSLTDMKAEKGERVGRMEFFAGAIGSYKNPHSHRDVNLNDPHEAVEIILLANHLLRIVDARAKVRQG